MSVEEFVLLMIKQLPRKHTKGIHSVYSGFSKKFHEQFPDLDIREELDKLDQAGKIYISMCRGGVMIYRPGDEMSSINSLKQSEKFQERRNEILIDDIATGKINE